MRKNWQFHPRILGIVLIALAAAGALVSSQEWRIADLEAAAGEGRTDRIGAQEVEDCLGGCNPRMALALSRLVTTDALLARDPQRRAGQLDTAGQLLDAALVQRPDWPSALIEQSYLGVVRAGIDSPAALGALEQSYRAARLSRTGAPWRVHMASLAWPGLGAETRTAMLEEALWFAAIDAKSRSVMESALVSGEAASAFIVRDRLRIRQAGSPDQPEEQ